MTNDKSKVLLSLLAGASAGVVAGLLLAPDSGKNSRASLKNSASKLGSDLDRIVRDGLAKVQEASSKLGSNVGNMASEAKRGADDLFDSFSSELAEKTGRSQGGRPAASTENTASDAPTSSPS